MEKFLILSNLKGDMILYNMQLPTRLDRFFDLKRISTDEELILEIERDLLRSLMVGAKEGVQGGSLAVSFEEAEREIVFPVGKYERLSGRQKTELEEDGAKAVQYSLEIEAEKRKGYKDRFCGILSAEREMPSGYRNVPLSEIEQQIVLSATHKWIPYSFSPKAMEALVYLLKKDLVAVKKPQTPRHGHHAKISRRGFLRLTAKGLYRRGVLRGQVQSEKVDREYLEGIKQRVSRLDLGEDEDYDDHDARAGRKSLEDKAFEDIKQRFSRLDLSEDED